MKKQLIEHLTAGQTLADLKETLAGMTVGGSKLQVGVGVRAIPYLQDKVVAWVDGPAPSDVAVIISAQTDDDGWWRRFTLNHAGTGRIQIDCFPTPFPDKDAPLAPGIPAGGF